MLTSSLRWSVRNNKEDVNYVREANWIWRWLSKNSRGLKSSSSQGVCSEQWRQECTSSDRIDTSKKYLSSNSRWVRTPNKYWSHATSTDWHRLSTVIVLTWCWSSSSEAYSRILTCPLSSWEWKPYLYSYGRLAPGIDYMSETQPEGNLNERSFYDMTHMSPVRASSPERILLWQHE